MRHSLGETHDDRIPASSSTDDHGSPTRRKVILSTSSPFGGHRLANDVLSTTSQRNLELDSGVAVHEVG